MSEAITPQNTIAYFDAIATRYDELSAGAWSHNDYIADWLRGHLLTTPSVLDIGAGTGQTVSAIHDGTDRPQVTAVEPAPKMFDELCSKFNQASPPVTAIKSTVEDYLSTNHDRFDIVTAIGVCEFIEDLPGVLGQLALRVAPEGLFAATYISQAEATGDHREFSVPKLGSFVEYYWPAETIQNSLTSNGLEILDEFTVDSYQRGSETVRYNFITATRPLEPPQLSAA